MASSCLRPCARRRITPGTRWRRPIGPGWASFSPIAYSGRATTTRSHPSRKNASPPLRRAQALVLRDLCAAQGITFIVNDDVNLAYAVDADGVHLGRDDAPLIRARQRL